MSYLSSCEILEKNVGMTILEYFVSLMKVDCDICIFGFGVDGKSIYDCMNKNGIDVCCICDNNWGQISERNIISPNLAFKQNPKALFVVSSHLYSYEMEHQLIDIGVPEKQILSFDSSIALSYRGLLPQSAYSEMVSAMHYEITGIYPNLDTPKTFNEKMLAAMIMPPISIKTELADKYKVRSWVRDKIGEKYLISLIGDWENVENIPWEELPNSYAMKLNHGSGFNFIVDGKKSVDVGVAKCMLRSWQKCNFGYRAYETQYIPIKPRIICEEYIENISDDVYDYKVFCFHGEPKYIMFLYQRKKGLKMIFLDLEWNVMPFVYSYPKGDIVPPKPKCLHEMIEVTKELCKSFDQVRVDWYVLNDGSIKFGEMTFTSAAGHAEWTPIEWDRRLGDMW
ncbi:MAG: hypothetical protein E7200_07260 [Selenomonas ruminantium]|nr:hypothetical protein [Selenomonas ruminantium]